MALASIDVGLLFEVVWASALAGAVVSTLFALVVLFGARSAETTARGPRHGRDGLRRRRGAVVHGLHGPRGLRRAPHAVEGLTTVGRGGRACWWPRSLARGRSSWLAVFLPAVRSQRRQQGRHRARPRPRPPRSRDAGGRVRGLARVARAEVAALDAAGRAGGAELSGGELRFRLFASGRLTRIPLDAITSVRVRREHWMEPSAGSHLLVVLWRAAGGEEDGMGFEVGNRDVWVAALGGER